MKVLFLSLVVSSLAFAADFVPPKHVDCIVTKIVPEHAGFFHQSDVNPPIVGDEVKLDFASGIITDITFDSGNALPFKEAGARMLERQSHSPYITHYEGTHQTFRYDYTAVLIARHNQNQSKVTIQISQRERENLFALHELMMSCARID